MTEPYANPRMQAAILPGGRLHLHDGPIDLVIFAEGAREAVRRAYVAAARRFASVLDELCAELPLLREDMRADAVLPASLVARRMDAAVRPLCADRFVTRMAAVAGSVADEVLAAMCAAARLTRACVNNGGDIAVHLATGAVFDVGMVGLASNGVFSPPTPALALTAGGSKTCAHASGSPPLQGEGKGGLSPAAMMPFGTLRIAHIDPVRGIATSGRGGRSFSLGIADAVTILAEKAANADAAATLVANAVDLPGHPAITRCPAHDLDPQSDLRDRFVTREVGPLSLAEINTALESGMREAERLYARGLIVAAALSLRGETRLVGAMTTSLPQEAKSHVV